VKKRQQGRKYGATKKPPTCLQIKIAGGARCWILPFLAHIIIIAYFPFKLLQYPSLSTTSLAKGIFLNELWMMHWNSMHDDWSPRKSCVYRHNKTKGATGFIFDSNCPPGTFLLSRFS